VTKTCSKRFPQHGSVPSAKVMMERDTGRSKGFGFVEMGSDAEAQAAINGMNGQQFGGRGLGRERSTSHGTTSSRSGGFGGGAGGGGGYGGGAFRWWRLRRRRPFAVAAAAVAAVTVAAAAATAVAVPATNARNCFCRSKKGPSGPFCFCLSHASVTPSSTRRLRGPARQSFVKQGIRQKHADSLATQPICHGITR